MMIANKLSSPVQFVAQCCHQSCAHSMREIPNDFLPEFWKDPAASGEVNGRSVMPLLQQVVPVSIQARCEWLAGRSVRRF